MPAWLILVFQIVAQLFTFLSGLFAKGQSKTQVVSAIKQQHPSLPDEAVEHVYHLAHVQWLSEHKKDVFNDLIAKMEASLKAFGTPYQKHDDPDLTDEWIKLGKKTIGKEHALFKKS